MKKNTADAVLLLCFVQTSRIMMGSMHWTFWVDWQDSLYSPEQNCWWMISRNEKWSATVFLTFSILKFSFFTAVSTKSVLGHFPFLHFPVWQLRMLGQIPFWYFPFFQLLLLEIFRTNIFMFHNYDKISLRHLSISTVLLVSTNLFWLFPEFILTFSCSEFFRFDLIRAPFSLAPSYLRENTEGPPVSVWKICQPKKLTRIIPENCFKLL